MNGERRSPNADRAPGDPPEPESSDLVLEIVFPEGRDDLDGLVTAYLFAWGSSGSVVESRGNSTVVVAWLPDASARDSAKSQLAQIDGVRVAETLRPRIDWLDRYEQSLVAIPVGERFVIAPREDLVAGYDRIAIVIPQEQAFGTGSHETTSMCLELLERIDVAGGRGADIGTGSGILAIGMAKLGASRVVAFDNDFYDTWGVVRLNMRRNAVPEGRISIFFGSADALLGAVFDVATMNILPHVIIELLPHVRTLLAPGARLILSGILQTQKDDVIACAQKLGLRLTDERAQGEWWAGVVRN